jgi:hypothetical protein
MDTNYRRYEILLPLKFNDGQPVPTELLTGTLGELEEHFGPVSLESQEIHGVWQHQGHTYRDKHVRVFIDVPDTAANREFFVAFKAKLKTRFQQHDIWITMHALTVV